MRMTDLDEGIMKNLKRAASGWSNSEKAITGTANKPKDIVKRNKGYDDETTKMLHKTAGGSEHSPAGLQKRVLDREMKKRGLGEGMEPEGDTLKNSLHTIIRVATHLDKALEVNDQFPEWISEKIGATKLMMVSVMDYLISDQEMDGNPNGIGDDDHGMSENRRDAYQRDYDSSRTGFSRGRREDDEYHTPDPDPAHDHARKETSLYNIKVGGKAVNPKPILGRSNALAWAKHAIAQGQFTAAEATLSPVHGVSENATAGATSAANVGTVVNPHISPGKARGKKSYIGSPGKSGTKPPAQPKVVQPKTSAGTAVNGLDIKSASLFGGPAVKR